MENERYIYGVGLVVVKGATAEYLVRQLASVVMAGAPEVEIEKVLQGNFEPVAEKLRIAARTYLKGEPDLIDRLNRLLNYGIHWMRKRGDLAHSTWILDSEAPFDMHTRLHIRSETEWWVGDGAFESVARHLGLVSVKFIQLMTDILERKGTKETLPMPETRSITRLDFGVDFGDAQPPPPE